jgi:hypothetical protein
MDKPFNPTNAKPGDGQPAPANSLIVIDPDSVELVYIPMPADLAAENTKLRHLLMALADGARSKADLLASKSPTSKYMDPVQILRALADEAEWGIKE